MNKPTHQEGGDGGSAVPGSTAQSDARSGIVLAVVVVLLLLVSLMTGAFMFFTHTSLRQARRWRQADQCLLSAQSGIEEAKRNMFDSFQTYFEQQGQDWGAFSWFTSLPYPSGILPQNKDYYGATVSVYVRDSMVSNRWSDLRYAEVTLCATATLGDVTRSTEELVRYGLEPSRIFDYSYFINNFGYFWGPSVTSYGDIRANGDMSIGSRSWLNGDATAAVNSENGAAGDVIESGGHWNHKNRADYMSDAPDTARPLDPPDSAESIDWQMGYDTNTLVHEHQEPLNMPYLGDLSQYESFSSNVNGRIMQNGTTIVQNVYSGPGPDGVTGTPDDGTLILDGTAGPITIDGPVVAEGDVIIKGEFTGQGCLYIGRNLHVVGDVIASDGPEWSKPDDDPEQTKTVNENKDLIGFAAKGNIIFGDYSDSGWQWVKTYMKPNFTHGYSTDPSDFAIGYDSDGNTNNGYYFNGDYTAYDGGERFQDDGTIAQNRRYYESCLSPADFSALCDGNGIPNRIDAVMYNNHLLGGRIGNRGVGFTLNGTVIGRDDAMGYQQSVLMNWDIRLGSRSFEGIDTYFLPQDLAIPRMIHWRELP